LIIIKNTKTLGGGIEDVCIETETDTTIEADGKLTLLPGIIDAHVHFRAGNEEEKETWKSGAAAAISGGVTTVFGLPNTNFPCSDLKSFNEKKSLIDKQLQECGIPLNYRLYTGADFAHLETIGQLQKEAIAIMIDMPTSIVAIPDENVLARAFQIGAQHDMMIVVHAKGAELTSEHHFAYASQSDPSIHSKIRDSGVVIHTTEKVIRLAREFGAQLYLLSVSTKEELDLIRRAKKEQLLVYAETTPHHLFFSQEDDQHLGSPVQVDAAFRTKEDQRALFEGIHDQTIDSVGSDHTSHTPAENKQLYGQSPSGIPGIETMLPLLLNAANEDKITLEEIVNLTRINLENIYRLPHSKDFVLVDMEKEKKIENHSLKTQCKWSPYAGRILKGWPVYTILNGRVFNVA